MDNFETQFTAIIDGKAAKEHATAFLANLSEEGETVGQIVFAARALRARGLTAGPFADAIDLCGTGGDHSGSVNISTAVALVVAAWGVPVAKHGNRAASSRSGSSDVLQALGVEVQRTPEAARYYMERFGITFMSAPDFHPVLKGLADLRRQIERRTIFNLLGPLLNPAGVTRQLVGVFSPALVPKLADALMELGTAKAWVVHGEGLDEMTVCGETAVAMLDNGTIVERTLTPDDAGVGLWPKSALEGGTPEQNAHALEAILAGGAGAYRDIVCLNAGAALVVADRARALAEGVALAKDCLLSGAALDLLRRLQHNAA